jgi:hypothetical protein
MPQPVESQGRIGEVRGALGAEETFRLGPYLDTIESNLHGRFFEATRLGRTFSVGVVAAFAGAATHVSPLPAGTGTPVVGLYNPAGNTKAASILRTSFVIAAVADTAIGLPIWNVFGPIAAPGVTAAGTPPVANLVGSGASTMRGFSNAALTGGAAGVPLRYFMPRSVQVAVATATAFTMMEEDTDGGIMVPPGCMAGLALTAAGTTFNITGSLDFEEVDWPL